MIEHPTREEPTPPTEIATEITTESATEVATEAWDIDRVLAAMAVSANDLASEIHGSGDRDIDRAVAMLLARH